MTEEERKEARRIFHTLWTAAVGKLGYKKELWNKLSMLLRF